MAWGSSSPTQSIACTSSSMESTTTPVSPSVTTSGIDPLCQATTGVPRAMASIMAIPNSSGRPKTSTCLPITCYLGI